MGDICLARLLEGQTVKVNPYKIASSGACHTAPQIRTVYYDVCSVNYTFFLKSSTELYQVEIGISIWQIETLGLQQVYPPDAKPPSQLVQMTTRISQPGSLKGVPSPHATGVPDSYGKSSGKRRAVKLCLAESLSKTCHCWNMLCSRAVLELASRDSGLCFLLFWLSDLEGNYMKLMLLQHLPG